VNNIGFLINDTVLHPGDALTDVPAPVLLVPGQAPWLTVPALVEYTRTRQRDRVYAIHDGLLNHWGLQALDSVLDIEARRAGLDIRRLLVGETFVSGLELELPTLGHHSWSWSHEPTAKADPGC
jgi:hypothetical protein